MGAHFVFLCVSMLSDIFFSSLIAVQHNVIEGFASKFFHSLLYVYKQRRVVAMQLYDMPGILDLFVKSRISWKRLK